MARKRDILDTHGQAEEVLRRFSKEKPGWRKERLLSIKLGLEGKHTNKQIASIVGCHADTINNWFKLFRLGGIAKLLIKDKGIGRAPALTVEEMKLFKAELEKNQWRTGAQAYKWLQETFKVTFHPNNVYKYLKKLNARMKVPRPSHRKKDPEAVVAFKQTLAQKLINLQLPINRPVRLWIYDEARYGLAPVTRKVWTTRGSEVVCPVEKRYQWGYVFGALQIGGGGCEFLLSPTVNKEADRHFMEQISQRDPRAMHVVIGDGAGFHHRDGGKGSETLPENVRLITLPPYSPELNPVEKLWDVMKDFICNQCFESMDDLDKAVTKFLTPYWEDARKVFSLIGHGYLPSKLNAIYNFTITRN